MILCLFAVPAAVFARELAVGANNLEPMLPLMLPLSFKSTYPGLRVIEPKAFEEDPLLPDPLTWRLCPLPVPESNEGSGERERAEPPAEDFVLGGLREPEVDFTVG